MSTRAIFVGGLDLAAQDKSTAFCRLRFKDGAITIDALTTPVSDSDIEDFSERCRLTGIDAPFGWPEPFVAAVTAHQAGTGWPGRDHEPEAFRGTLTLRRDRSLGHRGDGRKGPPAQRLHRQDRRHHPALRPRP